MTKDALKAILKSLGEQCTDEEIDEMMKEADADQDGDINFEGMFHNKCLF